MTNHLISAIRWDRLKGSNGPAGEIGELLRRLAHAKTRDEALRITGALLGQSTHTCTAVTEASAPVAEVLASLLPDPDFAWKADVLSTLDGVRGAVGGWKAVSIFGRLNRWERRTAAAVQLAVPGARALLDSPDPETRAMAAQFLGTAAPEPKELAGELRARFDAEPEPAVQAVLAEAYTEATIRGEGAPAAWADRWLAEQLLGGRAPIRFRIARALLRHPGAGDEELLRRIVDETARPGMAAMWPAEL